MALTNDQVRIVIWCISVSSTISLIAAAWMTISLIKHGRLGLLSNRLILYLGLTDMLMNLADLMTLLTRTTDATSLFCMFQAFFDTFSHVGMILLSLIIAFNLFCVVVLGQQSMQTREKWYLLAVYGVAFTLGVLPFSTSQYGKEINDYRCWVTANQESDIGHMWRFICLYIPLIFAVVLIVVLYMAIAFKVRKFYHYDESKPLKAKVDKKNEGIRRLVRKLVWYPIIFVLLWIFPLVRRTYNWSTHNEILALVILHETTHPLTGLLNAIVWGVCAPDVKGVCCCGGNGILMTMTNSGTLTDEFDSEFEFEKSAPPHISTVVQTFTPSDSNEQLRHDFRV